MKEHDLNSICNLALVFYVFTIQVFQFNNISRISMIIFVMLQALYILINKKFTFNYFTICNLLFIFFNIGLIYLGYSFDSSQSYKMIITLIVSLIINTMIIDRLSEEQNWDFYIKGFIIVSIILAVYIIISTNFNGLLHARSVKINDPFGFGVTYNANLLGLSFSFAAVFALYKYMFSKNKIYFVLIPVLLFLIMLTGSRKSLILFLVCISIVTFLIYKTKRFRIILITAASIVFIYLLIMEIPFFYKFIGIRVEGLIQGLLYGSEFYDASAHTRERLISNGFELFKLKPYTGYGLDTYRVIFERGLYAHNNYIELLVSSGIFGTILYYTMYIWMIVKLYVMQKTDLISKFLFAIIVYSIIGDYIMVSYSNHLYTMILAICAARIHMFGIKKREKSN